MYKKLTYLIALVFVLATCMTTQAAVFTDNFDTPHLYYDPNTLAHDVTGTIWDDFIGWYTGETVDKLNASIDRAGQLYIESTGSMWGGSGSVFDPLGPFLFKVVKGDFVATVQLTDYAGTPEEIVFHNDGGLMARAFRTNPDDAGTGEDWVSIDYFPIWTSGNFHWSANDDLVTEHGHNAKQWNADHYLQLERNGNTFHVRTSPDGVTWTEMSTSPVTRNDFSGLPLQVGLRHATYNTTTGYVAFDDFRLETFVNLKARFPVPADGATATVTAIQWVAGDFAAEHDVYIGSSFDAVNNANTSTSGIYKIRQPNSAPGVINSYTVTGLTPGETYYWRIDEVNDNAWAPAGSPWKGDVWSFMPVPYKAWNPKPNNSAECVSTHATLSWSSGAKASVHDVYFGTNFTNVNTATRFNKKGVLVNQGQEGTTYTPINLALDTTYYWRINEVNTAAPLTTWIGDTWSFKTASSMPIAEAGLVGWWKLDGTDCVTAAMDSSGYHYHGTLVNGPQWVPGYDNNALQFDGKNDYVELPIGSLIGSLTNSTFMLWVDSIPGGAWARALDFGMDDPNVFMVLGPRWWFMDDMYFAITTTGADTQILVAPTGFDIESGWQHVAVTINANDKIIILYYNGEELARTTSATLSPKDLGNTTNNWLGRSHNADDAYYLGSMDDFRIYNYVLSQAQIEKAMLGDPRLAWNPKPANGSTVDVERYAPLGWTPGEAAAKHDVYFGTDPNAVRDADTSDTTRIYRNRNDPNIYTPPEDLEWDQIYYWRIDEYNTDATVTKGKVWNFTVADYLVVDNFEAYDANCIRLYYTWRDGLDFSANPDCGVAASTGNGTGATVGTDSAPWVELSVVRPGGVQSMPINYNNTGSTGKALYSEVSRTFTTPQDWTRKGVRGLALWFYGNADNSVESVLYVELTDSIGNSGVATYSDPNELQEARWHEWDINPVALGVDPTKIAKIAIGIGDKAGTTPTGMGTIYIDDIRLYRPRCISSLSQPAADLNDDCVVNYEDIMILSEQWLDSGLAVTPVPVNTANLVGHWKLDASVVDSSGKGNDGFITGDTLWVTGQDNGALRFDGSGDYVTLPIGSLMSTLTKSSFTAWVKYSNIGGGWQRIFDFGIDNTIYMYLTPSMGAGANMRFAITTTAATGEARVDSSAVLPGGWHHVAVTISDPNGAGTRTIALYVDGARSGVNTQATLSPSSLGETTNNWLGLSQYTTDPYYVGLIDDFRIYNRALSAGEVAWLAGKTGPISEPYDFNVDGSVNFKDFAKLAQDWLEETLWP